MWKSLMPSYANQKNNDSEYKIHMTTGKPGGLRLVPYLAVFEKTGIWVLTRVTFS